jgi:hypothetical protein
VAEWFKAPVLESRGVGVIWCDPFLNRVSSFVYLIHPVIGRAHEFGSKRGSGEGGGKSPGGSRMQINQSRIRKVRDKLEEALEEVERLLEELEASR